MFRKNQAAICLFLLILTPSQASSENLNLNNDETKDCFNADGSAKLSTLFCLGHDLRPPAFFERTNINSAEQKKLASQPGEQEPEDTENPIPSTQISDAPLKSNPTAYIASDWLWTPDNSSASVIDNILNIPVCWINPQDSEIDRAGRDLTKTAIEKTWNSFDLVKFTGWTRCISGETGGVRIEIADVRPIASVGSSADTEVTSMKLNFTFNDPGYSGCRDEFGKVTDTTGKSTWSNCVHSIAVHEFGHSLGFMHEHDRIFYNINIEDMSASDLALEADSCKIARVTKADATDNNQLNILTTAYDSVSVMNYCFEIYDHRAELSNLDIKGFRMAYGGR